MAILALAGCGSTKKALPPDATHSRTDASSPDAQVIATVRGDAGDSMTPNGPGQSQVSEQEGGNRQGDASQGAVSTRPIPSGSTRDAAATPTVSETALQVSAGTQHSCALMADQSVRCWGDNSRGQTAGSSSYSSIAGISGVTEVSAGENYTCALDADKKVRCWGAVATDGIGALGNGPAQPIEGLGGVRHLTAGVDHACGLFDDDTVACWGLDIYGEASGSRTPGCTSPSQPGCYVPVTKIPGLTNIVQISAGGRHSCALRRDGTVWCWGENLTGQVTGNETLAQGCPVTDDTCSAPTPVTQVMGISGATQVSAGYVHTCALIDDGTVRCWGSNDSLQSGGGASSRPIAGLSDVTQISAGGTMTCALMSDSSVRCWGANGANQSAGGTMSASIAGLEQTTDVSAGFEHACARSRDGVVRCWGLNEVGEATGKVPSGCTSITDAACHADITTIVFGG
jgi:alpha-tubulin suppressor-like RCC1 family protein